MGKKDSACVRLVAHFSGYVQGVGFRYTAISQAQAFEVQGYVKNLRDGRVELIAEGARPDLEKFLERLKAIFKRNLRDVHATFEPGSGEFDGFGIGH